MKPNYKEWKELNLSELKKEYLEMYKSDFEDYCFAQYEEEFNIK